MKHIILLNPQPVVLKDLFAERVMFSNPPLGIGYLASAVRDKGFSVDLFDMGPERMRLQDLYEEIVNHEVKIVGISSFVANHGNGIRIAKYVKENFPEVKVIMGGPQASFIYREVLEAGDVDIVSFFEGEHTIPELVDAIVNGKSLEDIAGIAYRKNGGIVKTKDRSPIENLDEISFPAWDLYEMKAYTQPGVILTGRGCPYKCIFCSASVVSGARYRMRSTKNVVDEIEFLYNTYNISHFFFADDTFTADEEHCVDICREIRRRKLKIKWEAEARANTVNDFVVSEMVKAGCKHVQIGAESGDNHILKTIGKNVTVKTIERAVKIFLKHGVTVVCSFILGNPEDTEETMDSTIKFALRIKHLSNGFSTCKFSFLTPLPGTPVYENRRKLGLKLLSTNWDKYSFVDPIVETRNINRKALQNKYLQAWVSYTKGEFANV